jgi:hypothetical protein
MRRSSLHINTKTADPGSMRDETHFHLRLFVVAFVVVWVAALVALVALVAFEAAVCE